MFKFTTGDILKSDAYALINTVNCEGFMGKGLAYQFKLRYPEMNDEQKRQFEKNTPLHLAVLNNH